MAVTFTSGLELLQWWGCRVLRQWTRPSGLEPQHLILSTSGEQCCWTGWPLRSLPFPNLCDPNPAAIPGTNNAKMYTWFQRRGWREPLPPCNSPCEARRVKLGKGRLWKGESQPVPCLNLDSRTLNKQKQSELSNMLKNTSEPSEVYPRSARSV